MGWDPPVVRCKIEVLRLWNRLVGTNDQKMPKLLYKHMLSQNHPWIAKIKNIFNERYVLIGLRRSKRSVLAKLKLGVLQIHMETGRYKNTPRDQRCCIICNINGEVEDEIHFLLKCPQYKNIRDNLFTYATSTSHPNLIRNTANNAMELLRIRQNILWVK